MNSFNSSSIRIYGIFVVVSVGFLASIIYGFLHNDSLVFWSSILVFIFLGIIRILLMLRALTYENRHHKKYELKLQAEQDKLLALVNSLGEAVFAVDTHGKITLYNAAALDLLDSHGDILKKDFNTILPLIDKDGKSVEVLGTVLSGGKMVTRDDLHTGPEAKKVDLYVMATPVNEAGEYVGAIVMARDVSKQKNLQQQKDEFLSVVSHELRTPVAIVEADISTVLSPHFVAKVPDNVVKLLKSASQNITYLSGLLQDISDLSHSERMVLDVELKNIEITNFTKSLCESMQERAKAEGLELKMALNLKDEKIFSSEQRVQEILINFLTNAIKYSAKVGKTISLTVQPSQKFTGGIEFTVQDQGIGISPSDQKKLFHKFYRSANSKVQAIKGTGMGLYITQEQAKKIGGEIRMESELGKGSIFYLDLPASIPRDKVTTTQT